MTWYQQQHSNNHLYTGLWFHRFSRVGALLCDGLYIERNSNRNINNGFKCFFFLCCMRVWNKVCLRKVVIRSTAVTATTATTAEEAVDWWLGSSSISLSSKDLEISQQCIRDCVRAPQHAERTPLRGAGPHLLSASVVQTGRCGSHLARIDMVNLCVEMNVAVAAFNLHSVKLQVLHWPPLLLKRQQRRRQREARPWVC